MSIHEVLVVKIEKILEHTNADNLEIVKISGYDYSLVVRKNQFKIGDLGIFIEPDYVVNTTLEPFKFLFKGKEKHRITTRNMRGIWSQGLLIEAQAHHKLGDNVMEEYKVIRWEPNSIEMDDSRDLQNGMNGEAPKIPFNSNIPKYDLENFKKYSKFINDGEIVYYTSKIHGANARYVWWNNKLYCGSRTMWKREPGEKIQYKDKEGNLILEKEVMPSSWHLAAKQNPWIEEFCKTNPGVIVYGEIFGPKIQSSKFHYGLSKDELGIRIFDVLENNSWVSSKELFENKKYEILLKVPLLYCGPHDLDTLMILAEKPESLNNCNHTREGVVVKLENERHGERIGRIALKYISNNYLRHSE
jgi:RNA ligase (TIGR02306 family)